MPFPVPFLPVVGSLVAAVATLLLGRWRQVQTFVGIGSAIILALWIAFLPVDGGSSGQSVTLGNSWFIAGRPLQINAGLQNLIDYLFIAAALLFILTLFFWQGRTFIPASFAAISTMTAALMVQLFAFSAVLLAITVTLLVMTYSPVVRHKTLGSLRYLLLFVLALAPLLLAGWLFESGQANLNTTMIVTMLAAAFAVLLAGFPFYIWVYPIVAEAPFLVPALIFGLAQTVVVAIIFSLLGANPWLQENGQFQNWMTWSGTGTVLVATLLILTAGKWRFLLGHLLLLNMGMTVLTLTLPIQAAAGTAILFHTARFISLMLAGTALSMLHSQGWPEAMMASQGFGRRSPLTLALLAYSFLSLLGSPLTLGFPAQWALITTFGQQASLWLSALILLALAISAYRVLRILVALVQEEPDQPPNREAGWQSSLSAILLIFAVLIAIFPQPLLNYAKELTAAFMG